MCPPSLRRKMCENESGPGSILCKDKLQPKNSKLPAVDNVHNSSGEQASLKSEPGEYFLLATRLLGEHNLRGGEQIVTR